MLLHRKKYIQNKYIFFFFLFFFLFFQRFRRFSCILKVLYLYETNKYFKNSVFTPHNQLYICFHSKKKKKGFTLPKKKKKKKTNAKKYPLLGVNKKTKSHRLEFQGLSYFNFF